MTSEPGTEDDSFLGTFPVLSIVSLLSSEASFDNCISHGPGRKPAGRLASEPAPAQAQTGPTQAGAGRRRAT